MRSVIFFDIDGTIATEGERSYIPESTKVAINETRKNGNLTFINSGRTTFNIPPRIKELGFDGYICGCGTYIEYNNNVLLYHGLDKKYCRKLAELIRTFNVTPVYEWRDGYFFDDKSPKNEGFDHFMETFIDQGIDISRRVEDDNFVFDKFVIWTNKNSDFKGFCDAIGKDFSIIDRGNGFYENVPLGFTKATAIEHILKQLDIPIERAYAIGDSMNDLPMLEAVPNSIAMGGAETIYPYVSYITTPLEDDGIANALRHFNLI